MANVYFRLGHEGGLSMVYLSQKNCLLICILSETHIKCDDGKTFYYMLQA